MTAKRVAVPMLLVVGLLAAAPLARASDNSLRHALQPYKARLTADIGYLASFKAPSRSRSGATLRRLSNVRRDLTGASRAADAHRASTRSGRRGRTLVLAGLRNAIVAARDAATSATAARSGHRLAAKRSARRERRDINSAIPLFESGGSLLHLF